MNETYRRHGRARAAGDVFVVRSCWPVPAIHVFVCDFRSDVDTRDIERKEALSLGHDERQPSVCLQGVLASYRATGAGWQTRLNADLRKIRKLGAPTPARKAG